MNSVSGDPRLPITVQSTVAMLAQKATWMGTYVKAECSWGTAAEGSREAQGSPIGSSGGRSWLACRRGNTGPSTASRCWKAYRSVSSAANWEPNGYRIGEVCFEHRICARAHQVPLPRALTRHRSQGPRLPRTESHRIRLEQGAARTPNPLRTLPAHPRQPRRTWPRRSEPRTSVPAGHVPCVMLQFANRSKQWCVQLCA